MDDNQYFYHIRNSNTYTRFYVSINDVIMLKRNYFVSKGLLLSSRIVSFASPADGPNIPYVAAFIKLFQTCQKVPQYKVMAMLREQMLRPSLIIELRMTFQQKLKSF